MTVEQLISTCGNPYKNILRQPQIDHIHKLLNTKILIHKNKPRQGNTRSEAVAIAYYILQNWDKNVLICVNKLSFGSEIIHLILDVIKLSNAQIKVQSENGDTIRFNNGCYLRIGTYNNHSVAVGANYSWYIFSDFSNIDEESSKSIFNGIYPVVNAMKDAKLSILYYEDNGFVKLLNRKMTIEKILNDKP
jgi:hypothetical protein